MPSGVWSKTSGRESPRGPRVTFLVNGRLVQKNEALVEIVAEEASAPR